MSERKMTPKQFSELVLFFFGCFAFGGIMTYLGQPTSFELKNKEIVALANDATKRLNAGDTVCVTHQEFKGCVTGDLLKVFAKIGNDEVWIYRYEHVPLGADITISSKIDASAYRAINQKMVEAAGQFSVALRDMGAMTPDELRKHQNDQLKKIGG